MLGGFGVKRPPLNVQLENVEHPLVAKAQKIPELLACNEAEPILSLGDRRWLKVKVGDFRGGVTSVAEDPVYSHICDHESLWLGLAGWRQNDTPQKDFYATLPADTSPFLPQPLDWKRWYAEQAVAAQEITHRMVRRCAWLSLSLSKAFCFQIGEALVWVRVRMTESNIVYIMIGAHGRADPKTCALLMSSFPDVNVDDWLPEPDGVAEIPVEPGEMVFSAILTTASQGQLLEEADELEWELDPA